MSAPAGRDTGQRAELREGRDYSSHYDAVQVLRLDGQPASPGAGVAGRRGYGHGDPGRVRHRQPQLRRVGVQLSWCRRSISGTLPASHLPAVSFLKAPVYETGHPATSTRSTSRTGWSTRSTRSSSCPTWNSTAIFVTYDDSDGWYDHVYSGVQPVVDDRRRAHGHERLRHGAHRVRRRPLQRAGPLRLRPASARYSSSRPGPSRTT